MQIAAVESVEFVVSMSRQDLLQMREHPQEAVDYILKQAEKQLRALNPALLKKGTTRARRRIDYATKAPCPLCQKEFESQGMGTHFARAHKRSYKEYLERHKPKPKLLVSPQ